MPEWCREHYYKAPYVCSGCAYVDRCAHMHTYYSAQVADKKARELKVADIAAATEAIETMELSNTTRARAKARALVV